MPGNDSFTKILLHMEGADDGSVFTDSAVGQTGGPGTRSWTNPGTFALTSTDTAKFGSTSLWCFASVSPPPNGGHIVASDSADFTVGSSDFTVDFWANRTGATTGARWLFGQLSASSGAAAANAIGGQFNSSNRFTCYASVGGTLHTLTGTTSITDTSWHHYAMVRNGGTITTYLDGAVEATASVSGSVPDIALDWCVGQRGDGAADAFVGYIDEFRLSVGIARWTAPFTPPTEAYTDDTTAVGAAAGTGAATGVGASFAASVGAAAGTGVALADSTGSGINEAVGTATGIGEAHGVALDLPDVTGSCAAYFVRGRVGAYYSVTGEARV